MKLAVIGKDVSESLSPPMHTFIANSLGLDISYDKISIKEEDFESEIDGVLASYDGVNVTIPYKIKVMNRLKSLEGDAARYKSVNTVTTRNMCGHNTDGLGFELLLRNNGIDVAGKKCLLLGCGGAGRSVAQKLAEGGADLQVFDMYPESAKAVREECGAEVLTEVIPEKRYLIVNATGVGMHKSVGKSPVGEDILSLCEVAVDLIYVPDESEFLRIARSLGKKGVNGRAMLFYQAYFAECIYFDKPPSDAEAKELFEKFEPYFESIL